MTPRAQLMTPRAVAFHVLNGVFFQRRTLDDAYDHAPEFLDLEARDKGFVRLLVATVLKRAREMDAILAGCLKEPIAALKPPQVLTVLRLGLAQMMFLETPVHAAVNTSVELSEEVGIHHLKPLVNAVLRRLSVEPPARLSPRDAGRANMPDWLWQEWVKDYGVEVALGIASTVLTEAPVDFSVRGDAQDWAQKLDAQVLPNGSLRRATSGLVTALPGYDTGDWWVQNAAAAIAVQAMGDVAGKTVVDLCAAPGGKTAQLAADGAKVIAVDRSAARMRRLQENMHRLNMAVEAVIADGAVWQPSAPVDAVLLDAPCTATGTLRHQPDALHLKDPADQVKLAALQKKLLLNAAKMLKPGGMLLYCTCSLQKAEGEAQTDWLLQQGLPLRLNPITMDQIPEMRTTRGELRILPTRWADFNGIDGFYVARFARF
jgi:16S rRNA (cytosine967-C5)-methyltransferase